MVLLPQGDKFLNTALNITLGVILPLIFALRFRFYFLTLLISGHCLIGTLRDPYVAFLLSVFVQTIRSGINSRSGFR